MMKCDERARPALSQPQMNVTFWLAASILHFSVSYKEVQTRGTSSFFAFPWAFMWLNPTPVSCQNDLWAIRRTLVGEEVMFESLVKISAHFFSWQGRAGLNGLAGLLPAANCYPAHWGSHCWASSLLLTTSVNKDLNNKQKHPSLRVTVSFTGLSFSTAPATLMTHSKGSAQRSANFFSLPSLDGTGAGKWKAGISVCLAWITGFGLVVEICLFDKNIWTINILCYMWCGF